MLAGVAQRAAGVAVRGQRGHAGRGGRRCGGARPCRQGRQAVRGRAVGNDGIGCGVTARGIGGGHHGGVAGRGVGGGYGWAR